ncbi:uncharacterized protein LOC107628453 [Arachis ipaensis]|uniref:uncharacterized protein LOC107628453 n=1 Tax=Arachis ipaensis TaxID=130454 RepID=UPI000A2B45E4|nr:uncharacterized protein LOC107628453 [Arachis ipaensis]
MADSSTSQSNSKKTQPFHFRAKFENQDIQLVANLRNFHQHTIKLSIKNLQRKQSYNTQEKMAARNQPGRNQTKDLKCATHLLSDKFRNMSEEKKAIVRDLGFGGLMHIPPLRVHHQLLRELANNFKLEENRLETGYGSFKITPRKIGHALGINATGDLFPQKVDYKKLSEDDKHNGAKLKRACFDLYRQGERYEISSEDLDEILRENVENSGGQREKEPDMRSTEGRYVSSETIPDVNLGSDDPSSQRHTEQSSVNKPAESTLSLVQESASEPADSNIMVVREETPLDALAM